MALLAQVDEVEGAVAAGVQILEVAVSVLPLLRVAVARARRVSALLLRLAQPVRAQFWQFYLLYSIGVPTTVC